MFTKLFYISDCATKFIVVVCLLSNRLHANPNKHLHDRILYRPMLYIFCV